MADNIVKIWCDDCDGKGGQTRACPTLAERDRSSLPAIGGAIEFVACVTCDGRGYVKVVVP